MTWAAYAYIAAQGSDCTPVCEDRVVSWVALVQRSLPLLAADQDPLLAIVSSPADIQFREVEDLGPLISFPRGRLFGTLGELRWQPWCRGRHLVLVTDADTDSAALKKIGFEDTMALDLLAGEPSSYLLWGELESDGKWRDGRIPRDLAYPLDRSSEGRLAWLKVKRYVDNTGITQFTRYVEVIGDRRAQR